MLPGHSPDMAGFDAEFRDLDHYIREITARIWEGRRIDDIRRYYSDPCIVETPSSVTTSIEDVINGTKATLVAFPDRRLLAEDIIQRQQSVELGDLVNGGVAFKQRAPTGFDQPGQAGLRKAAAQGGDGRQRMKDVAHGSQANDENVPWHRSASCHGVTPENVAYQRIATVQIGGRFGDSGHGNRPIHHHDGTNGIKRGSEFGAGGQRQ